MAEVAAVATRGLDHGVVLLLDVTGVIFLVWPRAGELDLEAFAEVDAHRLPFYVRQYAPADNIYYVRIRTSRV